MRQASSFHRLRYISGLDFILDLVDKLKTTP